LLASAVTARRRARSRRVDHELLPDLDDVTPHSVPTTKVFDRDAVLEGNPEEGIARGDLIGDAVSEGGAGNEQSEREGHCAEGVS
jgi:hypothetical protein